MLETVNRVVIEGQLSEVDIEKGSYVNKATGENVEKIGGTIKVKVTEKINNKEVDLEIPVHLFSNKMTRKGGANPAYVNIEKLMTEFNSIAAVGQENADYIRITGASVRMNEYYSPDGGKLNSYPRVNASFINKIQKKDCVDKATWELVLFIGDMDYTVDTDGVETDDFVIKGVSVGYSGEVSIISVMTRDKEIAEAIKANYEPGDTVPFSGKVNFTSETKTFLEEVAIGEPIEKTRTVNVSELIITGVRPALEGELALTEEDVKVGMAQRTAKLENMKKDMQAAKKGETKAPKASGKIDIGF